MLKRVYDQWPKYLGRCLIVTIADRTIAGTFLGPQPMVAERDDADGVEPPWALAVTDGGIEFFDPDNPGVAVCFEDTRIENFEAPPTLNVGDTAVSPFLQHVTNVLDHAGNRVNQLAKKQLWHHLAQAKRNRSE